MQGIEADFSPADLADLALQRTAALISLGGGGALVSWFESGNKAALMSFLAPVAVAQPFTRAVIEEIEREVDVLGQHIDFSPITALSSIGPGLCMFELLLYRRHRCRLYLIDIERSDEHQHGFAQRGSGYSSNPTARAFLERNGVASADIAFCNPRVEALNDEPVDAILSNISMGFHYPVTEYVLYIERALRNNGVLIFDKRKGVPDAGWDALAPKFKTRVIVDSPKYQKLICERR
ncbi:MAG: hypothetical protein K2Y71_30330 [Xanthobacteraceae bacterium]|nr:hypothetical protein [Xanthobacteraceae bacterium]MBX9829409.1 hypothetical protein [Xanthobacteraceae bacterium]